MALTKSQKNVLPGLMLLVVLLYSGSIVAQDTLAVTADTSCVQKDLSDVVRGWLHKPAKNKSAESGSLLLLPIIGSNPATGFMFGV